MPARPIPNFLAKLKILREEGYLQDVSSVERALASPGWRNLLTLPLKEFEDLMHALKINFEQPTRATVLAKLTNFEFQQSMQKATGKEIPVERIKYAISNMKDLIKPWKLDAVSAQRIIAEHMWDFLFMRKKEAEESVLGKIFGNKIKFLSERGIPKEDVFAILKTPKGARWLMALDVRWAQEMRATLSKYKLGSIFPVFIWADLHASPRAEPRARTPAELEEQIKNIIAIGAKHGLTEEKVKAILRREPHVLVYGPNFFERYLGMRSRLRPIAKPKPRMPKPRA